MTNPEVVILGAGLAGMTAAYNLRDRDVVVIEARDRVGGRTLSGEHDGYWYNSGAQFVWDSRTVQMCRELGLDVLPGDGAHASVFVNGRLATARDPNRLFFKMPVSWSERVRFGLTIMRLRRIASRMHGLDAELDAKSLAEIIGRTSPMTSDILEMATTSGTGLSTHEVSGAIGLGYAIHLFGGDVNSTLKAVRGGTQQVTKAIAQAIDPERVMLQTKVESVTASGDGVRIRYRREGGEVEEIAAAACVCALTADAVLEAVSDLPEAKQEALRKMLPYAPVVSVAWLTDEAGPKPWDHLLAVPALGLSFELLSNNAFFVRRDAATRRKGGTLVTLATGPRAEALLGLTNEAIVDRTRADLLKMFAFERDVLERAVTRVERWRGMPRFGKGWLSRQKVLREPFGRIHFCGDYTAQPGTPGAVGSGYHAAKAVRALLG
ncbi:MAG TPA: NAD(P)/FAD-dependent oxidoreductase [Candidatus Dormibacteraeota bacterium]|nr:NAD(P)/FAD-dependent oxidoreductase [Candidatus Dormibacteraeota bacterium]